MGKTARLLRFRKIGRGFWARTLWMGALLFALPLLGASPKKLWSEAREAVSAKKYTQAIELYLKLSSLLDEADLETADAEIIQVYFANGDYAQVLENALSFLKQTPESRHAFTVSYLLASSLYRMNRFEEAFQVFGGQKLEDLRALDPSTRERVYELLLSSLQGMKAQAASRAMEAEVKGLWKNPQGEAVLRGPASDLLTQFSTQEALDAYVETFSDWETKRSLLEITDARALEPFIDRERTELSAQVGIGSVLDTATSGGPSAQAGTRPTLDLFYRLSSDGTGVRLGAELATAPWQAAGVTTLGASTDFVFTLSGAPLGLSWTAGLGAGYLSSWMRPIDNGFKNVFMARALVEMRYGYGSGAAWTTSVLAAPALVATGFGNSFAWGARTEYAWPAARGRFDLSLYGEFTKWQFPGVTSVEWTRLAVGMKLRFGALTHLF